MTEPVVLVFDEPESWLVGALQSQGLAPIVVSTREAALAQAAAREVQLVVVAWTRARLAGLDAGLETVRGLVGVRPELPLVVVADTPPVAEVVALVRAGALDVVSADPQAIGHAIGAALAQGRPRTHPPTTSSAWVPAATEAMRRVEQQAAEAARGNLPILVSGEVGVGKQRLARLIHARSPRRDGPFERVRCSALPADVLERELFGEESGPGLPGALERARGGTCLVAEIGEAPPTVQARLLQVLLDGRTYRVGGRTTYPLDVRVVATTSQDPRTLLNAGVLRRDLYDAFTVRIDVPPLRIRHADLAILLEHFLGAFRAELGRPPVELSPTTRQLLLDYAWPGNVQELKSVIKRFVFLGDEAQLRDEIAVRSRLAATQREALLPRPAMPELRTVLEAGLRVIAREAARQAERAAIRRVLEHVNWNRAEAARRLKISYKTLLSKLDRDDLGPRAGPPRALRPEPKFRQRRRDD